MKKYEALELEVVLVDTYVLLNASENSVVTPAPEGTGGVVSGALFEEIMGGIGNQGE